MGSSTPVLQYSSTPALQYSKTRKHNSGPPRTSGNQRAPEGAGAHWDAGPDIPQRAPGSYMFCCGAEPPRPLSNNSLYLKDISSSIQRPLEAALE